MRVCAEVDDHIGLTLDMDGRDMDMDGRHDLDGLFPASWYRGITREVLAYPMMDFCCVLSGFEWVTSQAVIVVSCRDDEHLEWAIVSTSPSPPRTTMYLYGVHNTHHALHVRKQA